MKKQAFIQRESNNSRLLVTFVFYTIQNVHSIFWPIFFFPELKKRFVEKVAIGL